MFLLNFNGNLLTYTEFLTKFNSKRICSGVLQSGVLQLLQGTFADTPISDLLKRLVSKVDVTKKKCSSKLIRMFLQKVILPSILLVLFIWRP